VADEVVGCGSGGTHQADGSPACAGSGRARPGQARPGQARPGQARALQLCHDWPTRTE
jgi:hypothetical protein